MIKITEVVEGILKADAIATESLKRNLLNLSQYSLSIHKQVETIAKKPVKKGSVTVALSRLSKKKQTASEFIPDVAIAHYSVISGLCEITYEKTKSTMKKLSDLDRSWISEKDYFAVSIGMSEVTIVAPILVYKKIKNHFSVSPKVVIESLAAITLGFSDKYMETPNTIFSLVYKLAAKRINIIEIISTYTELSFIVKEGDVSATLQTFIPSV